MASNDGRDGSISINTDVNLYASNLNANAQVNLPLTGKRGVWVLVVEGLVTANDKLLESGDGLAEGREVAISARESSEFLLFDMAL